MYMDSSNFEVGSGGIGGSYTSYYPNKQTLSGGGVQVMDIDVNGVQISKSISLPYTSKTATYTLTSDNYIVDCTANTFTINLPTAVGISGRTYVIKNSGSGLITVDGNGTETIDGATTRTLIQYESINIVSDGANWIII